MGGLVPLCTLGGDVLPNGTRPRILQIPGSSTVIPIHPIPDHGSTADSIIDGCSAILLDGGTDALGGTDVPATD